MEHVIRPVRADEWRQVRELRLLALQDPAAPVAFLETYENAAMKSDEFWQERAEGGASPGGPVRQFVAEGPDGVWAGSVTVLIEEPGTQGVFGAGSSVRQAHLVGVFVRAEYRGTGVTEALFSAAVEWARAAEGEGAGVERVRLFVHEHNPRAEAFYRKFGFVPSGEVVPVPGDPGAREREMVLERAVA
ncbi:GNAT family N-acetyltransferase [Streptomyces flavofungini]|uniref:GNAT family N-acetyltransferase n=1 Tax=Streptomyces flavofungini TaxID=68200 RepID=A0ABS0X1G5_9ACTN|nr:GNAT family N-acetyltransferase [Streptomyces flavofungini]MBJ3807033.1 GNAT family N-acetyltransferase [Streptomyces flavofungini]GHC58934.1 N-acetyltransferase [Streptomyces flavofungini]